jgi:hypothetical protein
MIGSVLTSPKWVSPNTGSRSTPTPLLLRGQSIESSIIPRASEMQHRLLNCSTLRLMRECGAGSGLLDLFGVPDSVNCS